MNDSEKRYMNLLIGHRFRGTKLDIENIIILMNNELNINTLSIQKDGRDTYYMKVDDSTKEYYQYKLDYEFKSRNLDIYH